MSKWRQQPPPLPSAAAEPHVTNIVLAGGAFSYIALFSMVMTIAVGAYAFIAMRQVEDLRTLSATCERERVRSAGRLEEIEKWMQLAADRRGALPMGGPLPKIAEEK